jgi:hypothetical protein
MQDIPAEAQDQAVRDNEPSSSHAPRRSVTYSERDVPLSTLLDICKREIELQTDGDDGEEQGGESTDPAVRSQRERIR